MRTKKEIFGEESEKIFNLKGYLSPVYWIEKVSGYKLSWFAKEWINAMHKHGKVNLIGFRGCAKSEIMAVWYTLWILWYEKRKEILITSHSREFAWKLMDRLKDRIANNELLLELRSEDREVTWNNEYIKTTTDCSVYTKAYKKTIAGLRTDYIITDESSKCVDDESFSIFHGVIEGTGHLNDAKELCMTTPETPVDLCYELKSKEDWVTFEVPILNEKGESNWPEMFSVEKIAKIRKSIGEHAFQKEYMLNSLAPAENAIYSQDDIVNCFDMDLGFMEKPIGGQDTGFRVLAADFAVAKGPRADYDAYIVCELFKDKIYIKHMERHRGYPKNSKVERLKTLFSRHKCNVVVVDPSGIGEAVKQDLKREYLPVREQSFHSAARSKLLMALQIAIADKRLVIPRNKEDSRVINLTNTLFNELIGFKEQKSPERNTRYLSTSSHDDLAISLAMAVNQIGAKRPVEDNMVAF